MEMIDPIMMSLAILVFLVSLKRNNVLGMFGAFLAVLAEAQIYVMSTTTF